jgi:hypothetical protein
MKDELQPWTPLLYQVLFLENPSYSFGVTRIVLSFGVCVVWCSSPRHVTCYHVVLFIFLFFIGYVHHSYERSGLLLVRFYHLHVIV